MGVDTVPYTVGMDRNRDTIRVPDRISWQRDGVRRFGNVEAIHSGFIIARTDGGVRHALRRRDVTKECG